MSSKPLPAIDTFFGEHPSMQALRRMVEKVARSKARTVLIYGETGTGKGLVARMLHELSDRRQAPFVDINCAAIPASLLESELFGHEKGAFTGAVGRKQGLIEAAQGGTFFLDEIRELDPVMQAKMLTLLDTRRMRRVGGVDPIAVDLRFVAATNKILLGEVTAGHFRDDLYYRLQVIALNIPPLRDRGDDVFALADRLMHRYRKEYDSQVDHLSPEVQDIFRRYPWPGNVRELENLIERICLLEEGRRVEASHLPQRILRQARGEAQAPSATSPVPVPAAGDGLDYHAATQAFQRQMVQQALRRCDGQLAEAARVLGLTRHALRHQMLKLGIAG
jgi:DNA-binding NtrC family response regulator